MARQVTYFGTGDDDIFIRETRDDGRLISREKIRRDQLPLDVDLGALTRNDMRFHALTRDVVSAYVRRNPVPLAVLPDLIGAVHGSLAGLESEPPGPAGAKASPAEIRKSVRPDGLVSFIDGKTYQTLKRHLSSNKMSFEDYKKKYGLPSEYPSVSADYSSRRSSQAKARGFGRK